MNPGKLRHRVTVQKPVPKKAVMSGEMINKWRDVCTVWAQIRALQGREFYAAQQTVAESNHEIIIRYREGLKPTMRVLHNNRSFDIQAVLDKDGTRRFTTLVCKEVF